MKEFLVQGDVVADVSIVIVNWNARNLLRDCIKSIYRQTKCAHEIIVVDNASGDKSADMVAAEFPDAALIANTVNLGFATANNQGIKIASGRYVLLLNPDTIILDGAIDTMIDWCDKHPNVGCAGCQIWETETVIQKTCFGDPGPLNLFLIETGLHRLLPNVPFFGRPAYSYWDRLSEREVDVVSGMFMLMPRRALDQAGLLDETFFMYAEEADLCRRIRQAGLSCVFTPAARILHVDGGGKSTIQIKPRMHVQLQKSLLIYNKKHFGIAGYAIAKAIFLASNSLRWVLFSCLAVASKGTDMRASAHLARVSLGYHLFGAEPES